MKNGIINDVNFKVHWYETWWKQRSKNQRKFIYALCSFIIVVLLFSILFYLFTVEPEVCTTPKCVRTSMELLNHIDSKIDPCTDFYQFACGNFLQNTNLDNQGSHSVQDITEDEIQSQIRNMLEQPIDAGDLRAFDFAKKFYRACMNESAIEAEGLKRIKQIFRQIGGWPSLDGNNWQYSEFDWKNAVHKLKSLGISFDIFFSISLDVDKSDRNKYILTIDDPFYSPSEISADVKTMYLDYMVDIATLFGANQHRARHDSNEVLSLLLKLAKISEEAQASNGTLSYNPFSLSELQFEFPSIQWYHYINGILDPAERITYDDVISVTSPVYLKKLEQLLMDTSNRTLSNFVVWHTLQQLINYLPTDILDRAYDFLGNINGKITRKPRWNMCVKATEERMNSVISSAYVEQYFDEDTRSRVLSIIRQVKKEFKYTLLKLDWLDRNTKNMAIEKLLSSVEEIVSYNDILDSLEQSSIYNNVEINENEFLASALNLDVININYKFGKLRQKVQDNWIRKRGFVTGLNIIFSPKENILRFPVGLFRGIYYQSDRPDYMNYGVLGSIIAHEISHIFIEAEYRDLPGELRSWWSIQSLLNYEEKLQCLSNQYRKFVVPELGKHLNSSKTRDEDMADLAGMKVSYDAYINWVQENGAEPRLPGLNYSPNQLFWISSAIRHCSKYSTQTLQRYIANYQQSPKQFRVNGPLQNIREFAFDFGCALGTPMNPEQKCHIW